MRRADVFRRAQVDRIYSLRPGDLVKRAPDLKRPHLRHVELGYVLAVNDEACLVLWAYARPDGGSFSPRLESVRFNDLVLMASP